MGYFKYRIEALQFNGDHTPIANWLTANGKKDSYAFLDGRLFWRGLDGNNIRFFQISNGEIKNHFIASPEIKITDWLVRRKGRFEIFTDEVMKEYFVMDFTNP